MVTAYDFYDYPRYWAKREYEDKAEKIALRRLLRLVKLKNRLVDIGAGFGRLTPVYAPHFKKSFLIDPSEKLLHLAKKNLAAYRRLRFRQGRAAHLPLAAESVDAALMIRVAHHLPSLKSVFQEVHRVLKPGGFFIFEFANKVHLKSLLKSLWQRRLGRFLSHLPINISTQKSLPFFNYHPNQVKTLLLSQGFTIKKTLSVSNFRYPLVKRALPLKILLWLEAGFSWLSSWFSPLAFYGPSVFVLAQKQEAN